MGVVVAKLQDRPHHDGDEEDRDIRLDVAQPNEIAVSDDQIAQLSFMILGYHRHFDTAMRRAERRPFAEALLPEIE